ncbi:response regulator receiver modulated metal dependent phosphohydrolase [Sulfurimonas gotlandica GD1]|uniref:Response regulator receiver modulated metal dependent phosphohydrolase n=1 Tax=Sulfurimonas gotlandica (strain DSM 19862 / JCM 16533 / GD1) TaxID=929558 RepID=B6BMI2_SULGG|nr:HD domain-containing phosphohydrolase [Sulfurimonas gotlandica]EDZ61784.1 response regulator receiver modulated metal dependent phosphohydrolase [Sulfurimonas gotlandica GD1]EHP29239.1 response regulator receiver modulated metal dependent phosphohydrolase [Sulfurimonas gotlandica GD1]
MNNSKYKVLIVDDVDENLKLVATILEKVGFETKTARDGLTALRLVKESKYDLILLDIMMPIMDGIQTCRYLKVEPTTESIPVIFLTASSDRETLTKAYSVGGVDYIKKPFFKEELLARVNLHLELKDYEKNLEKKVNDKTKEIADTQVKLMYTLGSIAEGHSKETELHVQRVAEFTHTLALLYGMDSKEAETLKNASSLHDIGKIGVTDNILHKPSSLSNEEFKVMMHHTTLGSDMLSKSELPLFKAAAIVCIQHHEKYDGSGYPKGLKGEEIHIYGRIVAIADVFDALSFKRAYKDGWTQDKVMSYIREMSGKQFDPKLIDIFFDNIDEFSKIYNLESVKTTKEVIPKRSMNKIVDWLLNNR